MAAARYGNIKLEVIVGAVALAAAKDTPDAKLALVAYCIDTYEFPGKGEKPRTGVSAGTATKLCKDGGKHLCSGDEWKRACGAKKYGYDDDFVDNQCNVEGKIVDGGSFPGCKSTEGVYDLIGNASEWAADGMLHGGDTTAGKGATCGTSSKRFMPGPTNGFRCCTDAAR